MASMSVGHEHLGLWVERQYLPKASAPAHSIRAQLLRYWDEDLPVFSHESS